MCPSIAATTSTTECSTTFLGSDKRHLTIHSSRRRFAARLNSGVSLRKTRFIKPHVLFTGVYLLKRLFVGF